MAVDILSGNGGACMYCTTSDVAFGPVMRNEDVAEGFRSHCYRDLHKDPREFSDSDLQSAYLEFLRQNVCEECGEELRRSECWMCKSSSFDEAVGGFHQEDDGDREPCEIQPVPNTGERFVCEYCQEKAVKRAARKQMCAVAENL